MAISRRGFRGFACEYVRWGILADKSFTCPSAWQWKNVGTGEVGEKYNRKRKTTAHCGRGRRARIVFLYFWLVSELQCLKYELGTQWKLCQFTQHLFWRRIQFHLQMLIVRASSASADESTPIRLLRSFRFNRMSPIAERTGGLNKHTWTGVKL